MIEAKCDCGAPFSVPESRINRPIACERCSRVVNPLSGEFLRDGVGAGDFDARLSITEGRERVGDIFCLGGGLDIEIGKLPGKPICLATAKVSRSHAKLVRVSYRPSVWRIEDCNSTNGVYVNGTKVKSAQLSNGDVIGIGDYRMKYAVHEKDFSGLPPMDAAPAPGEALPGFGSRSSRRPAMNLKIPARVPADDNALLTGKKNRRSQGLQAVLPLGIFPQPWQSSRRQTPITMWIIAVLTAVATGVFIPVHSSEHPHAEALNLMLWTGASTNMLAGADAGPAKPTGPTYSDGSVIPVKRIVTDEIDDEAISSITIEELTWAAPGADSHATDALVAGSINADTVGFHWYQLVTHSFVHRTALPCVINVLFILLLGLRLNELLGNAKMAVVYPLLAVGSALVAMRLHAADPLQAIAGASGVVMGLAGMYLVFFPISSIAIAIWLRLGFSRRARLFGAQFSIHGFWMVLLWLAVNDFIPLMISGKLNSVALKSHGAELAIGLILGMALLILRQVNGGGSDIFSVLLGKRAWMLVGRPSSGSRSGRSSGDAAPSRQDGLAAFNARLA